MIICGAGPAGAAAALEARRLRPDASVLLVDKAAFPRDKACGDGLGPHAVDELGALGAGHVLDGYPPIPGLRLRSLGAGGGRRAGRPNWVVPRAVLDARLVEAATAAGVGLRRASVRRLEQRDGLVLVDGELAARVVIAADGANSTVRRLLGASTRTGPWPSPSAARAEAPASPSS